MSAKAGMSARAGVLVAAWVLMLGAGCGGAAAPGPEDTSGSATLTPPSSHAGGSDALASGTPPSPPRDDANTIRWTTASEVSNYGYDVYRGDAPDGPFERISDQPLQGAGTTDTPTRYEFVDDTIEPGREYYYYVESIALDGSRQPFTPVRRAGPKPGAEPTEDAAEASPG